MEQHVVGNLTIGQDAKMSIETVEGRHDIARAMPDTSLDTVAIGRRLERLRETLGLTRAEMADRLSVDRTNYGRFETGARMLPLDIGYRISRRYSVTMDWLYVGRTEHLSVEMNERLHHSS